MLVFFSILSKSFFFLSLCAIYIPISSLNSGYQLEADHKLELAASELPFSIDLSKQGKSSHDFSISSDFFDDYQVALHFSNATLEQPENVFFDLDSLKAEVRILDDSGHVVRELSIGEDFTPYAAVDRRSGISSISPALEEGVYKLVVNVIQPEPLLANYEYKVHAQNVDARGKVNDHLLVKNMTVIFGWVIVIVLGLISFFCKMISLAVRVAPDAGEFSDRVAKLRS